MWNCGQSSWMLESQLVGRSVHLNTYVSKGSTIMVDHYQYFGHFSAGIVFIRQKLTSTDVRFWRIETVPALKGWTRRDLVGEDSPLACLRHQSIYDCGGLAPKAAQTFALWHHCLPRARTYFADPLQTTERPLHFYGPAENYFSASRCWKWKISYLNTL